MPFVRTAGKRWWMVPMLMDLSLVCVLLILAQIPAIAVFIYIL